MVDDINGNEHNHLSHATTTTSSSLSSASASQQNDDIETGNSSSNPSTAIANTKEQPLELEGSLQNNNTTTPEPSQNQQPNHDITCSICLETFVTGNSIITSACNHSYHRDCVMDWMEKNNKCPNCRQNMWDEDTFALMTTELMKSEQQRVYV
eukprot:CAMPEP_0202473896 /NCGR_PEP_ID=MMETSP1360-20130828/92091_1 /ASSEMBLY_ACC=CAM_ASM_000848 /TAXON_ID=515479 /ORGANISM="Licmophora paradoxa, Strain CCMP2313" /LENGTH=152 /DNA_ID=CAMNT_0049100981 /DNA_START=1117 /DNA_END=1575 /DNA_ORIENTATION=-